MNRQTYLEFKAQLLKFLVSNDPLALLESGLFQKWESLFFGSTARPSWSETDQMLCQDEHKLGSNYENDCTMPSFNIQIERHHDYTNDHYQSASVLTSNERLDYSFQSNFRNESIEMTFQLENNQPQLSEEDDKQGLDMPFTWNPNKTLKYKNLQTLSSIKPPRVVQDDSIVDQQSCTIAQVLHRQLQDKISKPALQRVIHQVNRFVDQQNNKLIKLLNSKRVVTTDFCAGQRPNSSGPDDEAGPNGKIDLLVQRVNFQCVRRQTLLKLDKQNQIYNRIMLLHQKLSENTQNCPSNDKYVQ